jgi:putative component of membrane protein insertase Oxa1/YidC/SpoIIIJ protein YidD
MKFIALYAIRVYQRYISPRKGFSCAYRCHTGRSSCSVLGYRAIRRYGVIGGLVMTQTRLKRCAATHRRATTLPRAKRAQMGFIDGCDGCNFDFDACSVADACSGVGSCPAGDDCSDCSINPWAWKSNRERKREQRRIFS